MGNYNTTAKRWLKDPTIQLIASLFSERSNAMKTPDNEALKLVSLGYVVSEAQKDKVFFNSLLKAPEETLENNGLRLSEADGKKLSALIAEARKENLERPLTTPPGPWEP